MRQLCPAALPEAVEADGGPLSLADFHVDPVSATFGTNNNQCRA